MYMIMNHAVSAYLTEISYGFALLRFIYALSRAQLRVCLGDTFSRVRFAVSVLITFISKHFSLQGQLSPHLKEDV